MASSGSNNVSERQLSPEEQVFAEIKKNQDHPHEITPSRFLSSLALGIASLTLLIFAGMAMQGTLPNVLNGSTLGYITAGVAALYIAQKTFILCTRPSPVGAVWAICGIITSLALLTLGICGATSALGIANMAMGVVIVGAVSWAVWLIAMGQGAVYAHLQTVLDRAKAAAQQRVQPEPRQESSYPRS